MKSLLAGAQLTILTPPFSSPNAIKYPDGEYFTAVIGAIT